MIKRRSQILCFLLLISDLLVTTLAWIGAYYVRCHSGWVPVGGEVPDVNLCLRQVPLLLVLCAASSRLTGQYEVHRLRRFREEVVTVFKGTALLALLMMSTIFFLHDPYESRAVIILFSLFAAVGVLTARRLAWGLIRFLRSRGLNQKFSLIVGSGRVARKTARSLRRTSWLGIKNVGFVDERRAQLSGDLDILGGFADLPELIKKYQIEHVFIALPMGRYDDARRVYGILSQQVVDIRLVADTPNLAPVSLTTSYLDGVPLIGLRESPHYGLNVVIKRFMDIVLALLALIVLSPVFLVIAILVKVTSPGPVLFRQQRCGLNGKLFHMLKFRSMRVDAEKQTGAVWTQKNDPRRTVLGTMLRETSLDELPQFINVLLGDMSLVGPRPERPEFIKQFSQTIPSYMARHAVKAGITGWAQVNGWRGNTSLRKRIQYDLYYITHWNPWLDLRIMWMTVFNGLVHRNAY